MKVRSGRRWGAACVGTVLLAGAGITGTATKSGATTLPELRVADVTTAEGDAGVATLPVPVTLSSPATVRITLPYTVTAAADGVTDGHDFVAKKGQLTFGIGKTTANVGVSWVGDTIMEPDQHVLVVLGTPIGGTATIGKGTGEVTIVDDDSTPKPPGSITASIGDITIAPPDSGWVTGSMPVTLSQPAAVKTKLVFGLDCNALASIDNVQIRASGALTFAPGQREQTITFRVYANDKTAQQVEDIAVNLKTQLAAVPVVEQRGDVTVNEDGGSLPLQQGYPVPNFAPSALPGPSTFDSQSIGDTEQVDLTPSGDQPDPQSNNGYTNWGPGTPSVSYDGRYVAFISPQADLVPGDTNGMPDVFVRDRLTNTTERVSLHEDGSQIMAPGTPWYATVQISADGRFVVYDTVASLDPNDHAPADNDATQYFDVYLYDRVAHTTELVSRDSAGNAIHGMDPEISADGRYVAWRNVTDIYVRDRLLNTTTLVFKNSVYSSPVLSRNGQYVLVAGQGLTCLDTQLDVVDLSSGTTERIDVNDDGVGADEAQSGPGGGVSISDDGRYVAFESWAWQLAGLDGPTTYTGSYDKSLFHLYIRDRQELTTTMVDTGPLAGSQLSMSGAGDRVALSSNGQNAQVYDLNDGTSRSVGPGTAADNLDTLFWSPTALSGDGRYLAFLSDRYGTVANTTRSDLFAARVS